MATDGDFILTISDYDEEVLSNPEDFKIEPTLPKANIGKKRKRGLEAQVEAKKGIKKVQNLRLPSEGNSNPDAQADHDDRAPNSEEEPGQPDEAIDPDFEFDFGPNYLSNTTEDFDGWNFDIRSSKNSEKDTKGVKRSIDIDEIIARRMSSKRKSDGKAINSRLSTDRASDLQSEQALEEGVYEDDDKEHEGGAGFLDFGDDELLAMDGFGAGAASEDGVHEEVEDDDDSAESISPLVPDLGKDNLEVENVDSDSVSFTNCTP